MKEQELNRALAEWSGFKEDTSHWHYEGGEKVYSSWISPNNDLRGELPKFTQSLDVCLFWLIPELAKRNVKVIILQNPKTWRVHLIQSDGKGALLRGWRADSYIPAIAFCDATKKLIDVESE